MVQCWLLVGDTQLRVSLDSAVSCQQLLCDLKDYNIECLTHTFEGSLDKPTSLGHGLYVFEGHVYNKHIRTVQPVNASKPEELWKMLSQDGVNSFYLGAYKRG